MFSDVSNHSFDPFTTTDFELSIGMTKPMDPRIATYVMQYVEEIYPEDTTKAVIRKTIDIPLKACEKNSPFQQGVR